MMGHRKTRLLLYDYLRGSAGPDEVRFVVVAVFLERGGPAVWSPTTNSTPNDVWAAIKIAAHAGKYADRRPSMKSSPLVLKCQAT